MQALTVRNGNPGPIADGAAAIAAARATLSNAQTTLASVSNPQARDKQLLQVYIQAKRAAGALISAAADPRTGHAPEYSSAAEMAKRAAQAVGQALVALRDGQAGLVTPQTQRLHNAAEVLGMAYIGAMSGAQTHA